MKTTYNTAGQRIMLLSQCKFMYAPVGVGSSAELRLIGPERLHWRLANKLKAETLALKEWWSPWTNNTRSELFYQHLEIGCTFPFVRPAVTFDEEISIDEEDDPNMAWRKLSGFVVLAFKYTVAKGSAVRTADRRGVLQLQLLAEPLLGPSIVAMFKQPARCVINVVIAAGNMKSYAARVNTIMNYLHAAKPRLYRKATKYTSFSPWDKYRVGYDPEAYFGTAVEGGYVVFPKAAAMAFTAHTKDLKFPKPIRKTRPQ